MVDRGANIDLIFRNGLAGYEVAPPSGSWEAISGSVRVKKRPFLPARYFAAAAVAAAVVALPFITTGYLSEKMLSPALTMNQEIMPGGTPVRFFKSAGAVNEQGPADIKDGTDATVTGESVAASYVAFLPSSDYKAVGERDISLQENRNAARERVLLMTPDPLDNDFSLNQQEIKKPEKRNRLSLGAMMTPSYYSRFAFGADDAGRELIQAEKGAVSYTGGVSVAFDMGSRISFQTGIYYSSVGQKVTGVDSYSGYMQYAATKSGTGFSVLTANGTVKSTNGDIFLSNSANGSKVLNQLSSDFFDPAKAGLSYLGNSIDQNFGYLEIPLIFKYKLVDRRIDFRFIGGLSYNMLLSNRAFINEGGVKYILGKTEGLSPVTFSSSLGLGFEYSLAGSLSLNVEPVFRYYLTPLGGTAGSSIHPYSFGLLSGIAYRF